MKLIVGLGNPGKEYEKTRHNAGFIFLDNLIQHSKIASSGENLTFKNEKKFEAEIVEVSLSGEKIILVKPQTFMNLSGGSVRKIMDFYKIEPKNLIIVADDVDLPVGMVRIRKEGTSGGHNGLQNIIDQIKTDSFCRIRLGISFRVEGRSPIDTKKYVLDPISDREKPILMDAIGEAIIYILEYLGKKTEIPCHSFEVISKTE